ncbi:MAG: Flp pilus assembly protein CpaB [Azospirillum brasilense]|nr:MAG: Flp pilus assembly protein CpaB [Azospirillum brasilense]
MPARSIAILILGLVIAVGTAVSLKSRMGQQAAAPKSQVLVAAADIPAGSFVRAEYHLKLADWPQDNITPAMLTSEAVQPVDYEGAVARRAISTGEAITNSMLVKSNEGGFMSAVLEPGKRAVSIPVDPTSGNAGFIFPGDRVDLILTHKIDLNGGEERASETFIEDVRVLAVDQMLDNPENKAMLAKTVTLEVTPKQAEEINVAKDLGKISLSLRSLATKKDAAGDTDGPTTFDEVLQQEVPTDLPPQNLTRDTDVSKIITPRDAAGTRVRVLRPGAEPQEIEFNPEGASRAQEIR